MSEQEYDGYEPYQALYYLFRYQRKNDAIDSVIYDMSDEKANEWYEVFEWVYDNPQKAFQAIQKAMKGAGDNE